jgi:hypothetical protein
MHSFVLYFNETPAKCFDFFFSSSKRKESDKTEENGCSSSCDTNGSKCKTTDSQDCQVMGNLRLEWIV